MKWSFIPIVLILMCSCSVKNNEIKATNDKELLLVKHIPNPVIAKQINNSETRFRLFQWTFRTEVTNRTQEPLRIKSFGCYEHTGGNWVMRNIGYRLYNDKDFIEWYRDGDEISNGWIQPGHIAVDNNNWVRSYAVTNRFKWYYVAVDSFGKEYVGEEEVELIPYYDDSKNYWTDSEPSKLIKISGKIQSTCGKSLQYAQIRITPYVSVDYEPLAVTLAEKDGSYTVRAEKPGIYRLYAYSPGHNSIGKTIALGNDETDMSMDIRMCPHEDIDNAATDNQSEVILPEDRKYCERIWYMEQLVAKECERYIEGCRKYEENDDSRPFEYDWIKTKNILIEYVEKDPIDAVRRYAALKMAEVLYYDPNIDTSSMNKVFITLPSDSPYWGVIPYSDIASKLCMKYKGEYGEKALMDLYERNPDRMVRAYAISYLASIMKNKDDLKMAAAYYDSALLEFSDIEEIKSILRMANPYSKVIEGREIPDFQVISIDDQRIISKKSMLGKYYLIHFWATWCGPCKREMKVIHDAYGTFKTKNFTILSISFDRDVDVLNSYRNEQWHLPWINSIEPKGTDSELGNSLEVYGVPKLILVNPEGVILETKCSLLRGQKLASTLTKYLND
jgi:thiol-disulfide isomerase/thioredoxin